jgi:adenosylcobinamide-GDP ribazoletransferase
MSAAPTPQAVDRGSRWWAPLMVAVSLLTVVPAPLVQFDAAGRARAVGLFPAARPDGLGATFRLVGFRWPLVVAGAVTFAVAAATGPLGVIGVAIATAAALLGGNYLAGRLGGLTGDTYGALAVVAETVVLFAAVALRPT